MVLSGSPALVICRWINWIIRELVGDHNGLVSNWLDLGGLACSDDDCIVIDCFAWHDD